MEVKMVVIVDERLSICNMDNINYAAFVDVVCEHKQETRIAHDNSINICLFKSKCILKADRLIVEKIDE